MGQRTIRPFSSLLFHTNENAGWCNSCVTVLWFTERQENRKQCLSVYILRPHKTTDGITAKGNSVRNQQSLDKLCNSSQWCIQSFHPGQSPKQIIKEKVINIIDWKCCWVFSGWPIQVTEKLLYLQLFGWKGTQFLFYWQRQGLSWDYACFLNRPGPFYNNNKTTNTKNLRRNSAFPCNHTTCFFGKFQLKRRVWALIKHTAHPCSYWLLQNL